MATASSRSLENFIDATKVYLKKAGKLSEADEKQLRIYGDVNGHLKVIVKALSDGEPIKHAKVMKKACEDILHGEYINMKNKAAALSAIVQNIKKGEADIPKRLRPKAMEIMEYKERITDELTKADKVVMEMKQKMDEVIKVEKRMKLTDVEKIEFKMMQIDLKSNVKIASNDNDRANEVLASFESDINCYLAEQFGITLGLTAVVAGGGAVIGAGAVAAGATSESLPALGAAVGGCATFLIRVFRHIDNYNKLKDHQKELESMLSLLKQDYNKICERITAANERMNVLENPDDE